MSWDIYGNPLQRGHCEVHPHVNEEYPCSVCLMEREQRRRNDANSNAQHDMILEVEHLKMQRDELLSALELMLGTIQEPPEANCSCHITAPCSDCVTWSGEREAFELANRIVMKIKGGEA